MRPDDWTSPDLRVKLALLEDRSTHLKDKLDLHSEATDARLAVLDHRMQQADWQQYHHGQTVSELLHRLADTEAVVVSLRTAQAKYERLGDYLRYVVAASLILATISGRIAPEWTTKGIKLLGLLP